MDKAADPGSGIALQGPPEPRGGIITPRLGGTPVRLGSDRESARLELRRSLTGQVIRLSPELRDCRNPDNPLALDPHFPWDAWLAAHPSWHHNETGRYRWAFVMEDGTLLKAYSIDFLLRLRWVVRTLQPLMEQHGIEVVAWYEGQGRVWSGLIRAAMEHDGVYAEQSIVLCGTHPRDTYLLAVAVHELAHGRPSTEHHRAVEDYFGHKEEFRIRYGRLLRDFLAMDTGLRDGQLRFLRSYAVEDRGSAPIHPGPERSWHFDDKGRYLVLPHPVDNPPERWDRKDW